MQTLNVPTALTASQTFLVSSAAGTLNVNAALTFNGAANATTTLTVDGPGATNLAGAIGQASSTQVGSLVKTGSGTLTLSGVNTYTGNTTVSTGTLAITGGSVGVSGNTAIFTVDTTAYSGTSPVATLGGGTLNTRTLYVGTHSTDDDSFGGNFTMSGGTLNANEAYVGDNGSSSAVGGGTFLQTGGNFTTNMLLIGGSNSTYTLQGGTLTTASIENSPSNSTFNFNGGTLRGSGTTGFSFGEITTVNVQAGGARIDTNGQNCTLFPGLSHDTTANAAATDGGLTKLGSGTLTLDNPGSFNGVTMINAGTLNIVSPYALQSSTLILSNASGSGTVTFDPSILPNEFTLGGLSGNGDLNIARNDTTVSVGNNGASTTYSGAVGGRAA